MIAQGLILKLWSLWILSLVDKKRSRLKSWNSLAQGSRDCHKCLWGKCWEISDKNNSMVTLEAVQTIQLVEEACLTSPLPDSAWSVPLGLYRFWYPKAENCIYKYHCVVVLVFYTCCIQCSQKSHEQIIILFMIYIWRDWCPETINKTLKVASTQMGK